MASGGKVKEARKFSSFLLGPQLQALYRSSDTAMALRYLYDRTHHILEELKTNGGIINEFDDVCHGEDIRKHFESKNIGLHDFVLVLSVDGAQLYQSKQSDCWVFIWVILNLSPDSRYKKKYVLPAGIIPGPNKPKNLDSFLFPSLYHLASIQNEGLRVWDSSRKGLFTSYPFLALATADAVAMATLNGSVGHHGGQGCRRFCGLKGRHKPGCPHYYPAALRPDPTKYSVPGSCHGDIDLTFLPPPKKSDYLKNLRYIQESPNPSQYRKRRLETGIVKPSILSGLPRVLEMTEVFPLDVMHAVALNIPDHLLSIWRGVIPCDKPDSKSLWDFAVLKGSRWKKHGKLIADTKPYLPGSFDRVPRNPAKKINSGYKAWEWLLYVFALGPAVFRVVLPQKYFLNFCRLVFGVRILQQRRISRTQLLEAHRSLVQFVMEFESIYYQRIPSRLHFLRQCIHILVHLAPEVFRVGPGGLYSQWTLERTIGNLVEQIRQHITVFAHLTEIALRRCRINALMAMVPELNPPQNPPRGSQDIGGGYRLLKAMDSQQRPVSDSESNAVIRYYGDNSEAVPIEWRPLVRRWARLQLPNGQIARSAWKECLKPLKKGRMARMVKVYYFISKTPEYEISINFYRYPVRLVVIGLQRFFTTFKPR